MKLPLFKSLQFRLPFLVLLGVIPTTIIAIALSSSHASKIIRQETQENLALEAKALKDNVSRWTQMNVLALKNLTQQPGILSSDPQQQKLILETVVNTYEYIYLAHTTDLTGMNIARSDEKAAKSYGDRFWFKGAKAGNEITFQTLIGRTSKKPTLCLAAPIQKQTTIAAVACICSVLEELTQQVGTIKFGKTGYGFIVDEQGRILGHPDSNLTSGDELTDYSSYPPVANLLAGKEGYFLFTDEAGIKWISHGTRLDNGWSVFILQQKSEAFLQEREFQKLAGMVALAAVGAVGILTWLLANRLTQPITEITAVATSLAEGNLNQTVNFEREDEIGILAQSFNSMAKQLQKSFINLQDRTIELDESLKQQNLSEQKQRLAKEKLERQVRELENKLTFVNKGDLTIQATVTDDEIGRVASSYNSMVESLRKIVTQVKTATQTVAETTNHNENAIQNLSSGANKQKEEITAILVKIQAMAASMQTVALNSEQAETIIKQASAKVKAGDIAINQTVDKIVALGQTTSETKEQVKRLGKASRKIAKAVELIRKIALQTNVLAVNTSIEAARAGEEGLGFTVVADEVQSLAAQSAQTATEIEKLVLEMQAETSKVIQVMEDSSKQVLAGSKQVEETRVALQQITTASQQINQLVEAVNSIAMEQSQNSQIVSATIQEVAAIAQDNSISASSVSDSFQELLIVAKDLQDSIGQFKVS
ncbi:MAG: methyl-accepting chemotaxis protein [Xenococcaceae cyanobacterium MO_188.B29]|nr:methyl-accepting chemotaxis protein [Xenococcaceae cyanobacterium MO_188.B29]